MGRMSTVKYREFEAEFNKSLVKAESEAQSVPTPPIDNQIKASSSEHDSLERLMRIAEVSPRAAITESWTELELLITQIANSVEIDPRKEQRHGGVMPSHRMIEELTKNNYFPKGILPLFNDLRRLRNKAAHQHDFDIGLPMAQRYIHLVQHFADKLQALSSNKIRKNRSNHNIHIVSESNVS